MRLPAFLAPTLLCTAAFAASGGVPLTVTHNGHLLDGSNAPVTDSALPMTFRIFDRSATVVGETLEWEATCTVAVTHGYYAVVLGHGDCAGTSSLDTADLPSGAARWLEVAVDGVILSPRLALTPVPHAAVAERALSAELLGTHPASDFALAGHGHEASEITGLAGAAAAAVATLGVPWASIADKPSTFAPGAHTHLAAEVTDLGDVVEALEAAIEGRVANERLGTLSAGKWCLSDGNRIECTGEPPPLASAQAKVGAFADVECVPSAAGVLWYDTTELSMKVCDGTAYVTLKSRSKAAATGGTVTTVDGYRIHTFTESGSLEVTSAGPAEVLLVGGGGGGGGGNPLSDGNGGGGGGGVVYRENFVLKPGTWPVVVGEGGAGGAKEANSPGQDGSPSTFSGLVAHGGGGGGSDNGAQAGRAGGSGGGASASGIGGSGGPPIASQGFAGGDANNPAGSGPGGGGGGGGGAGGPGGAGGQGRYGGSGGIGVQYAISGSPVVYAGGGGGASWTLDGGPGGPGGGGRGASRLLDTTATSGAPNSGGGGGAGASDKASGAGGSGIVIIRYPQ